MQLNKMANEYESIETLNIAELDKVSVSIDVEEVEFTKEDGETFKILRTEIDGKFYRIPKTVLKDLKQILQQKPDTEFIKVSKSGSGMSTNYTVIPL